MATSNKRARRALAGITSVVALCMGYCLFALVGASIAHAQFGVTGFSARSVDADGTLDTRAGAHPYAAVSRFDFTSIAVGNSPAPYPYGSVRDVVVDLPRGFAGDLRAVPTCDATTLSADRCPPATQIGLAYIRAPSGVESGSVAALFNIAPSHGSLAVFGFKILGVPILMRATLNPDGYTVRVTSSDISQDLRILSAGAIIWGDPADPVHDVQRGSQYTCNDTYDSPTCNDPALAAGWQGGRSAGIPRRPFVTNPMSCSILPVTSALVRSWQEVDRWVSARDVAPEPQGCGALVFEPVLSARASTAAGDAPTGLDVDLSIPQSEEVVNRATPHLRDVEVELPDGLTINPGSANGLQACSDEQLGLGTDRPIDCPDGSRIGTVTAKSPALEETLEGGVYVRSQASDDPASGEMFRMALVVESKERGVLVKLPGQITVDERTGRVRASVREQPQLPVSEVSVRLKAGPRAPLATPRSCGQKTVGMDLLAWSGHRAHRTDALAVDCTPGLGGFAPSLAAGSASTIAGGFSPFAVSITKPDGNADLDGLSMKLPQGLLASLKGNVGQPVGTVKAFAGPGSTPFMLAGKVFLEGAYGDAPFSLRVVVPAKAGPFDLGEVVVRQKIYVDPVTTQVTVVSDPVPTIVKGVPARMQRLDVNIDKPGFVINPTSCAAKEIKADLHSAAVQTAALSVRFQVGGCNDLQLSPTLGITLTGKGQTTDGKHPAVTANLTQSAGESNLKKVRVALPLSLALDPDNAESDGLCSFTEGSKPDPKCPASSVVGKATAVSPILNQPLTGPVYFTKNERKDPKSGRSIKTLPKLVIPLVGENGVKLTLTGTSDVVDDQLVTTFDNIPDAPVSSFRMDIVGGKKGILVISNADICKATQTVDQQVDGQNGKDADTDVFIQSPSCPLKVLSKKVSKRSVILKVGGLGAGKVTITGKGIKKITKTISKSTVATITAKRTKGKPGKATISFDPAGPAKARKTTK
jgi:hypothetical protein